MTARKISVLHLFASLPVGGAEDLLKGILSGLNPEIFAPRVACLEGRGAVGEELVQAGYPVAALGLHLRRDPFLQIIGAVRGFLRQAPPDILHTHLYHPNLYGRLAALGLGLPGVVAAVHNSYTRVKFHRQVWNFVLAAMTDRLLVGSTQVYRDVRRYDRVPAVKLALLPYGIRLEELQCSLPPVEAKAALGLTGFVVGTIGRLEEQKGQRYLLEAAARLTEEISDLTVAIVGSGRWEAELHRLARELGLSPVVRFLGTRRDLALIYRALDVFVLPSLWEGLPLALLKAMGAGLPVVATRVSGTVEAIADGVSGLLVPPGEAEPLAAAIGELHRAPQRRSALGEQARQTVARQYSLTAMVRELESLYQDLAHRRSRP